MSKSKKTAKAAAALRVEGEMTIFRAAELKPQLLCSPALQSLDLVGVTEIDTAGVQLLLMARRAAQAEGGKLELVASSPAVDDVLALLNVCGCFGNAAGRQMGECHES